MNQIHIERLNLLELIKYNKLKSSSTSQQQEQHADILWNQRKKRNQWWIKKTVKLLNSGLIYFLFWYFFSRICISCCFFSLSFFWYKQYLIWICFSCFRFVHLNSILNCSLRNVHGYACLMCDVSWTILLVECRLQLPICIVKSIRSCNRPTLIQ